MRRYCWANLIEREGVCKGTAIRENFSFSFLILELIDTVIEESVCLRGYRRSALLWRKTEMDEGKFLEKTAGTIVGIMTHPSGHTTPIQDTSFTPLEL